MITLIISEIGITMLQLFICGIPFSTVVSIVARILFLGKLLGMRVKLGVTVSLEIIAISLTILVPVLFKGRINGVTVIVTIIAAILSSLLMWYDDAFYIYTEEEV